MIRVKLSDAIQVDVNTNDPAEATREANAYFQQNFPREFSEWRNSQVGMLGTLGRGVVSGMDEAESRLFSVAEGLGQSLNLPSLQEFARQGRQQAQARSAQVLPEELRPPSFEQAQSAGDYARFGLGAIGQAIPSAAAPIVGGVIGGAIGGVPGAIAGAALGAYPDLAGSNIQRQLEEEAKRRGVPVSEVTQIPSPGAAFATAVPQALAEGVVDALTLRMARILGRPVNEVAESLLSRIAKGIGVGARNEIPAEVFQTALERAQAGLNVFDDDAIREYKEVAAGAAVVGGVAGGAARGLGGRAQAPAATPQEAAVRPEAAPETYSFAPPAQPVVEPTTEAQPTPEAASAPEAAAPEAAPTPTPEAVTPTPAPAVQPEVAQAPVTEAAAPAPEAPPQTTQEATPATNETAEPTVTANRHIGNVITEMTADGFTTAKGSTYQINEQGQTIRTKLSPGRGQGTTYEPHNALYVTPQDSLDLLTDMQGGGKYRFVVNTPDGPQVLGPDEVIGDRQAAIAVFNPNGSFNRYINAEKTPAVGLAPIELRYDTTQPEAAAPEPTAEQPAPSGDFNQFAKDNFERKRNELMANAPPGYNPHPAFVQQALRAEWEAANPPAQTPVNQTATSQQAGATVTPTPPSQQPPAQATGRVIQNPMVGQGSNQPTTASRSAKGAAKDQIGWLGKIVSPITMLPFLRPALRPAAESMRAAMIYENLSLNEGMRSLDPFHALRDRESKRRVTLAWRDASRSHSMGNPQPPNTTGFTQEEKAALDSLIKGGQRALDYEIESRVIDYYDSSLPKNSGNAANIDAMWQQYSGRRLWQIPLNVLQSVSPEGFAQIQKLNAIRNPYYMPQIADGSHFIAVYKRNPNGTHSGKPIAMQAYYPLTELQKRRNFEDPEARIIADFQTQFPDPTQFYIMPNGVEFTANEEARKVRGSADAVSEYLSDLQNLPAIKNSTAAMQRLNSMVDQLRKASMDRLMRPNQNILQAVNDRNVDTYIDNVLPRYYAAAAKIQARNFTSEGWTEATRDLSRNDKAFLNDNRDYATTPTEAYGGLRSLTYVWLMGGAPDSAFLNGFQLLTSTAPIMSRDGGMAGLNYLKQGMNLVLKHGTKTFKPGTTFIDNFEKEFTDPVERAYVRRAFNEGIFDSIYTIESRGAFNAADASRYGIKNAQKVTDAANKSVQFLGSLQQSVEQQARAATFVGAMRLARAKPQVIQRANQLDGRNLDVNAQDAAYQYATNMVQNTHYVTNRYDRPYFMRFTPMAEVATQFMGYPIKTAELYFRQAISVFSDVARKDKDVARAGILGFLNMTAATIAVAGIWGLPFADFLKELSERLIKIGWGTTENFDSDLRRILREYLGDQGAEAIVRGIPHAFGGVALSRRLSVDPVPFGDLASFNALTLFGPTASFPEQFWRGIQAAQRGDYFDAAVAISPRALGNVLKGYDMAFGSGEIRSTRGNLLISAEDVKAAEQRQQVPIPFALRVAFGFQPSQLANQREFLVRQEEIERQNQDKIRSTTAELARYLVQAERLRQQGRASDAQKAYNDFEKEMQKIALENDKFIANGRLDRVLNITRQSVFDKVRSELYGATSQVESARAGSRLTRPRIQEEREIYYWRDRPSFAEGGEVRGEERFPVRQPYESELEFFEKNPNVTGMAAEDGKVILNPYSDLSEQEREAVVLNERARLAIREGLVPPPNFVLTPEQMAVFSRINNGRPYGNPQVIKETLAARILSGDPSAQKPTRAQLEYVEELRRALSAP